MSDLPPEALHAASCGLAALSQDWVGYAWPAELTEQIVATVWAAVVPHLAVRDVEMTALRERAETAEEALDSSRTALDRVIAFARSLADTDPAAADRIAETILGMAGECAPGAALALLNLEPGRG